ncbi:hypothetical protein RMATCC62417_06318 [Rhizopus microsporus]|nr:hypothetical protein RMATCC62417_06318 [Rhizopus microsporus]
MCSKCFHATDHDGHDVKIWISRGAGGCCDCGDPEAWKVPLNCKIHSLQSSSTQIPNTSIHQLEPLSSVPPALLSSVRETITVIADYILETFAASPEDVMSIGSVESIKQDCLVSHRALGLPIDLETQSYACILWNDEKHSFDDVIAVVKNAIGCTHEQAEVIAQSVDRYGRHIVKESKDIQSLITAASIISSIGLAVTICSVHKTVREEIAGLLLDWLKELVSGRYRFFNNVEGGNTIIRDTICQVLSTDWALRPDLARLSTRYRRARMPEEEDDSFEFGDEDGGMDSDGDEIMFDADNVIEEDVEEEFEEGDEGEEHEEGDDESSSNSETHRHLEFIMGHHLEWHRNASERLAEEARLHVDADRLHEERDQEILKRRRSSSSSQPKSHKTHKPRDILDMEWNLDAWLDYTDKLELAERQIAKDMGVPLTNHGATKSSAEINSNLKKEFRRKLRLDYILQFDLRLWKTARMDIKDLLIGTYISNYEYRPILGVRFARNYPELIDAFFFKDREPENSVSTLSVQLLTVPTVASILVKDYKFFGMVCSILSNFFLTDRIHMILPEDYSQAQVDPSFRAIARHRYAYTIYDLRYVMNAEQVKLEISKSPLYLRHFIDMLYQFQAMDPLKRQSDAHVEYESNTWMNAFNVTLQIVKLCRLYAACFDALQSEIPVVHASYNLCRTVYRVLKAIRDWNPRLSPVSLPYPNIAQNRIIIKGISEQKYHQVSTPHIGPFDIIDYDVTVQPVSFHHPFHWLLSELFENVSLLYDEVLAENGWIGGFKQMVNNALQDDRRATFLDILEYPIRTLTILSQINCGVWVRNGYGIRNQFHTYRDINVRENTLDRDIFLLQVGFVVCNSDQLLLTLIDRFQLQDWFKGKWGKTHPVYDSPQKTFMVEELLNLLIISATEHGYASGTSTEQRIRRAIIQYLGLSSLSYSELLKLIPDTLTEHESFEAELNKVANFRAPDGVNDKGMYEIKPECLDEIDPYFWHYTRNKREEAHVVLRKRWNQLHPESALNDKEEFLVQPNINRIEKGPFRHLNNFLHSKVFCQILIYALWNSKIAKQAKSETILDEALYLGILAVTDVNNEQSDIDPFMDTSGGFVENATENEYAIQVNEIERVHSTLLSVLIHCVDDKELSHTHKRLCFIIDKIEQLGNQKAKDMIGEWKERRSKQISFDNQGNSSGDGMSEYERKKAAAKARQAAIMSQFAQAQSKFMEQHADLYKDEEDFKDAMDEIPANDDLMSSANEFEIVRKCHFPTDNCIVCQEELDGSQLYGMLGLVQRSNVQRLSPVTKDVWSDILDTGLHLHNPWGPREEASNDKGTHFTAFPTGSHVPGVDISSCGHLMHAECFETYQQSVDNQDFMSRLSLTRSPKGRFLCPLCKALGNVLVPIVWKGKKETYPGVMAPSTSFDDMVKSLLEVAIDAGEKVAFKRRTGLPQDSNLVIADEERLKYLYNKLIRAIYKATGDESGEFVTDLKDSLYYLYDMYAYTISNFEVAQRGAENTRARDLMVEHTGTFIDDISRTSQTLLKILSMTNGLVPKLMESPWQTDDHQVAESVLLEQLHQLISSPDKPSTVPVLSDDPFKVLVRLGFLVADYPEVQAHHLMRALYLADLTKTVIGIAQVMCDNERLLKDTRLNELLTALCDDQQQQVKGVDGAKRFIEHVLSSIGFPHTKTVFDRLNPKGFTALLRLFTLPYLRKSLLLMTVHHGFIPQSPSSTDAMEEGSQSEYDRLLDTLNLPSFETIFNFTNTDHELLNYWCQDFLDRNGTHISLNLPIKYRLTTLPYRLDVLLDESSKRICRKCNSVPEHSAICLICGTFVCARRFCCTEGTKGECNVHMKR